MKQQPNLHDLANMTGAGNATKELKKSGHWDEYAGLEYKKYRVWSNVSVYEEIEHYVDVKARTSDEAELLAQDDMRDDYEIHEILDTLSIKELPCT